MRIYFARHGQSEANLLRVISNRDLPHGLTDLGRQQAAQLADRLAGAGITHLFASPVLRAAQTGEILSARLGLPCQPTEALREYDCGVLEGQSDEASWSLHHQVFDDWLIRRQWDSAIPGGETFNDIRARFEPFIRGLVSAPGSEGRNYLLVGHGGLYLCMLPVVLTNIEFAWSARQVFPNTAYVLAEQTSTGLFCREWCGNRMAAPPPPENLL